MAKANQRARDPRVGRMGPMSCPCLNVRHSVCFCKPFYGGNTAADRIPAF